MSMIDATMERDAHEPSNEAPAAAAMPRIESPIVPQSTIAGRALVAVVAIMTFLAALTTGAVMLVRSAASEWQSDLAREVTIQLRPSSGRDVEADVASAVRVAGAFPGVAEVRPYSKEEAARLLEPWLGTGLPLEELPIPRVIVVRIASGAAPDLAQLRAALTAQVPGVSLDDHRTFVDRMRSIAGAAVIGGIGVLALVIVATILSVTFATRAAMATNRPVIEVLHFVGARNSFINGHFQRHFLLLGLKGGAIGGGSALALFALAEWWSRWSAGTASGDQVTALFGTVSIGVLGYVAVLAQVLLIAGVTALASRYTVNRTIEAVR